jgi:hypothetical protein
MPKGNNAEGFERSFPKFGWFANNEAKLSVGDGILICDIGGGTNDFSLVRARLVKVAAFYAWAAAQGEAYSGELSWPRDRGKGLSDEETGAHRWRCVQTATRPFRPLLESIGRHD